MARQCKARFGLARLGVVSQCGAGRGAAGKEVRTGVNRSRRVLKTKEVKKWYTLGSILSVLMHKK